MLAETTAHVPVLSGIRTPATAESEPVNLKHYHSPVGLFGFQVDGVCESYLWLTETDEPVCDLLWGTGLGKALAVDEPVSTPSGWKSIGDLRPGDEVHAADGTPAVVTSVHPQGVRDLYRVTFSDGTWSRCDADHLWTVTRKSNVRRDGARAYEDVTQTLTLREIMARGLRGNGGRRRWRIPIAAPVQRPEADLPVEPYSLGVLLGDAYIGPTGRVWLTTDKEILDAMEVPGHRQDHPSIGIETLANNRHWERSLCDLGLAGARSWEKRVPPVYLLASEDQRRALLAGLLDTDGSPTGVGGTTEFSSASRALAEAVVELAQSLGGIATITSRVPHYTHKGERREGRLSWRVMVKMPVQPHRLARKAGRWVAPVTRPVARYLASVEPDGHGEAVCIKVDRADGLFLTRSHIVTHNTHWTMATAALLVEDGLVDQIVVVAEGNKVTDWVEDFARFTDIPAALYAGTPEKRRRILSDPAKVLVMTYETGRNDICTFKGKGSKAVVGDKFLTTFLKGKRVLIVFDEFSRLRSRNNYLWTAWDYLINRVLRRPKVNPAGRVMVAGLTATKIERSPEDHFNANLLLMPWCTPKVSEFEKWHIRSWDPWGNPEAYFNLGESEAGRDLGVVPLSRRWAHRTLKKHKSDPDVIGHFPAKVEEPPRWITLTGVQREFYDAVEEIFGEDSQMAAISLLRQIAGHPMALTRSHGESAKSIVDTIGTQTLTAMGSAKEEAMVEWATGLGGDQGVVFTFYGQSILPLLHRRLTAEGFSVSVNHGQMSRGERAESQRAFKAGETQIFLSSDAGARGLNLGCGSALLHYELPLLYSTFLQRSDRIHRIDSAHESVTISALIAKGTIEEPLAELLLKRNGWSDAVLHDDDYTEDRDPGESYLTAEMRKALWARAKRLAV